MFSKSTHCPLFLRQCTYWHRYVDDKGYDEEMKSAVSHNSEQVTVMQYFADIDMHVHSQHKYNVVKTFQRYNAPAPSSSSVEHLFSVAGHHNILGLSDKMFEKLTLLKMNGTD